MSDPAQDLYNSIAELAAATAAAFDSAGCDCEYTISALWHRRSGTAHPKLRVVHSTTCAMSNPATPGKESAPPEPAKESAPVTRTRKKKAASKPAKATEEIPVTDG